MWTETETNEVTISECTRQNTCYDCDNEKCWHHGTKEADCPKYHCDRPEELRYNCNCCAFIDNYIKTMRAFYKKRQELKKNEQV